MECTVFPPAGRSVGQESSGNWPVESVFPNAIITEFVKEMTMWHLVEHFAEINLLKTSPKKEISLLIIDQESLNIRIS